LSSAGRTLETLTLNYDNFYPNALVAGEIMSQLKGFGVSIRIAIDDFHSPAQSDADIKLMILCHMPYDDRTLYMLLPNLAPLAMDTDKRSKYETLLDTALAATEATTREQALTDLDNALIDQALIIPLLKLNEAYLAQQMNLSFISRPIPTYS
jgi:MarR-like DNA-binding transcriptional regulator SgrR of sgrS sRNA